MTAFSCRACRSRRGDVVLDLGEQPAADHFPPLAEPLPDAVHPLAMWLCADCGLAQLTDDPTVPAEPRAVEPRALAEQAAAAVREVADAGWLAGRATAREYGSPHGGSWLGLLHARGLSDAGAEQPADVLVDCFGIMHCPDQAAAAADRAARLGVGGVLLLQYHSLATIVARGQWNSLRHGHFAYYSAAAISHLFAPHELTVRQAWPFPLYGGTVLLALTRADDGPAVHPSVTEVRTREAAAGAHDADTIRSLQRALTGGARALRRWLVERAAAGDRVVGYGAASRTVALLSAAGVSRGLLPAVVDAAPGKQGRRMPATDIPIVAPTYLDTHRPTHVLLFLPDLLPEVRAALPEVEAGGGRWVDVDGVTR